MSSSSKLWSLLQTALRLHLLEGHVSRGRALVVIATKDKDWYEPVTPLAHMTQMKKLSRCALIGSAQHGLSLEKSN
eukprot:5588090-Amphidinium_carterae.3